MEIVQLIGVLLAGILVGLLTGFLARKKMVERQYDSIRNYSKKIINDAHKKSQALKKESAIRAKDTFYQLRVEFEKETKEKKEQLTIQEKRLFHKEENLDKKIEQSEQKEKKLAKREKDIDTIETELKSKHLRYDDLITSQRKTQLAGMSREPRPCSCSAWSKAARCGQLIRRIEIETRESAHRKAQKRGLAIGDMRGDYVAEDGFRNSSSK
jgi:ribonuclease Y